MRILLLFGCLALVACVHKPPTSLYEELGGQPAIEPSLSAASVNWCRARPM